MKQLVGYAKYVSQTDIVYSDATITNQSQNSNKLCTWTFILLLFFVAIFCG